MAAKQQYTPEMGQKWIAYMLMAASHSKDCATHWFRYLRKEIDKRGITFSQEEIDILCKDERLTPFQRISLEQAFIEGSPTRERVCKLNQKYVPIPVEERVRQYERYKATNRL
ncbi:MAG: hypothetical protein FWC75_06135 [Oscillospiraceae bacterium]|nr:hypothetical protein [Oscillospiraceae bacterium]